MPSDLSEREKPFNFKTIVSERQNNPELVVQDCKKEFGFTEAQCETVRHILLRRGINKWLYARRKFIKLKHEVKEMLRNAKEGTAE